MFWSDSNLERTVVEPIEKNDKYVVQVIQLVEPQLNHMTNKKL
jgi:hypothetical protein